MHVSTPRHIIPLLLHRVVAHSRPFGRASTIHLWKILPLHLLSHPPFPLFAASHGP